MKKMLRMFTLLFAVCLLLSMTACGQPDTTEPITNLPEGVSYGIKVVNGDGEPIVGALVSICQDVDGGICYMPVKTDENGMAYFNANMVPVQDNLKFRVLSADGYELPLDDAGDIRYTIIPSGTVLMIQVLEKAAN